MADSSETWQSIVGPQHWCQIQHNYLACFVLIFKKGLQQIIVQIKNVKICIMKPWICKVTSSISWAVIQAKCKRTDIKWQNQDMSKLTASIWLVSIAFIFDIMCYMISSSIWIDKTMAWLTTKTNNKRTRTLTSTH